MYSKNGEPREDPYEYISKDGENQYSIRALYNIQATLTYCIEFEKTNLHDDKSTRILILFATEKQLDNFCNKFNITKIEKEFERIKNIAIKNNAYIRESSVSVLYEFDGSNIKF